MPKILSHTLPIQKTPWIAAIVLFFASCLFLPLGKVEITASVSSFGVLLVFLSIQISTIILRFYKPHKKREFKIPFSIGQLPIIPCVGILITFFLLTQFKLIVYMIGSLAILLGLAIYFAHKYISRLLYA